MKKIYFIRHAKSSWSSNALKDIDRPLNARGRRDAPYMANVLKEKIGKIDGIIHSPAQRIRETVKPFIEEFSISNEMIYTAREIYEGSLYDLLEVVHSAPPEWDSILLFGHNPAMTYIAHYFGSDDIDNVPTCGILGVFSTASSWVEVLDHNSSLNSFLYPKLYFNA